MNIDYEFLPNEPRNPVVRFFLPIISILYYIVSTIVYGIGQILIGVGAICVLYVFLAVLIIPPMTSFQMFVDGDMWYGSIWLIITCFVYGVGFKNT